MWKAVGVIVGVFSITVVLLIYLQPSAQESALGALGAAEKVLDGVKASESPAKVGEARRLLVGLKVPARTRVELEQAIADLDEGRAALAVDQSRLAALSVVNVRTVTDAELRYTARSPKLREGAIVAGFLVRKG